MSQTVSRAEFARMIGRDRAWVTRLAQNGRLKLADDGRVLVEESKALMEQTRGARDDVQRRHEEHRQQAAREYVPPDPNDSMEKARRVRAVSEARRSAALAEMEELELKRARGAVIDREQVELAMRSVGASLGALLDVMAPQLAPLVAPVADLDECHAVIAQYGRDLRTRFAEACERQAKILEAER